MSAPRALALHPDRLFPAEPTQRAIARRLYAEVRELPIISPHGHTDPRWFASDEPFENALGLLVQPDHYLLRMLYSQGVSLEALGVTPLDGGDTPDPRSAWRLFASRYSLFRGTPSRTWLDHVFAEVFGLEVRLAASRLWWSNGSRAASVVASTSMPKRSNRARGRNAGVARASPMASK